MTKDLRATRTHYQQQLTKHLPLFREFKGFTRHDLAEIVGISATYLAHIEGHSPGVPVALGTAAALADGLECSLDALLGRNVPPTLQVVEPGCLHRWLLTGMLLSEPDRLRLQQLALAYPPHRHRWQ